MRLFLVAVRLLVLSLLLASQLIADARADSAAFLKCVDMPDGMSGEDLVALCNSVMETEKDLPPARIAKVLQARGVGNIRRTEFDQATADFDKALEVLPPGSDERLRQILMAQRDISIDRKKSAAEAEAANTNNWLLLLAYVAAIAGIWAISFRTRIGALAYGTAGRISRRDYWYALVAISVVAAVQALAMVAAKRLGVPPLGPIAGRIFFVGWMAAILLAATAVSIKRLHDRNRSAWMVVLPMAAVLAVLLADGSLLAAPSGDGPFSDRWQRVYNGVLVGGLGLTPAGPALIAGILFQLLRLVTTAGGVANVLPVLAGLLALAASLWYLSEVGFRRGTVGPNSYGPDPLSAAATGSSWTLRISPQARRYAAAAAAVVVVAVALYAFAPWRLLSTGPDQANIEAFADEHCRHAREEMSKDFGLSPNRKSAADTAIRACTIVIAQDTRAAIRADSYATRGKAYEVLEQKEKAIADYKEAVKLKPGGGAACDLANMGVAGYECSAGGGGAGVAFPPMGFN